MIPITLDLATRPYARPAEVKIMLSGNPCQVPGCGYLAGDGRRHAARLLDNENHY